jgi:hypothetical protein
MLGKSVTQSQQVKGEVNAVNYFQVVYSSVIVEGMIIEPHFSVKSHLLDPCDSSQVFYQCTEVFFHQ